MCADSYLLHMMGLLEIPLSKSVGEVKQKLMPFKGRGKGKGKQKSKEGGARPKAKTKEIPPNRSVQTI